MPMIHLTDEAARALRACADRPFQQTGTQRPDGSWDVPVEEDTLERLKNVQLAGESMSDTVMRVAIMAQQGGKH
jgi:hypothetical protein